MNKLSILTGFLPLPSYHSFGYHYSKWEAIDTDYLMSLLDEFNKMEMPLDNLWLDIDYTNGRRYFAFEEWNFRGIHKFLSQIEK